MLTKTKLAIVMCGVLTGGVAAAQGTGPKDPERAEHHAERKAKRIAMRQKMLERFDTNKDGKLDDNERLVAKQTKMAELFKRLDTDGNGSISLAELQNAKLGFGFGRGKHGHGR